MARQRNGFSCTGGASVSRANSMRFSVLFPANAAPGPCSRPALPSPDRLAAVLVVQIFVAERQPINTLRKHPVHTMLDPSKIPSVSKTFAEGGPTGSIRRYVSRKSRPPP